MHIDLYALNGSGRNCVRSCICRFLRIGERHLCLTGLEAILSSDTTGLFSFPYFLGNILLTLFPNIYIQLLKILPQIHRPLLNYSQIDPTAHPLLLDFRFKVQRSKNHSIFLPTSLNILSTIRCSSKLRPQLCSPRNVRPHQTNLTIWAIYHVGPI